MVTPETRVALLKFSRPLKPQGPDLIVTVRMDLFDESMLEQDAKGKPRDWLWKKFDKENNRVVLAFGPGR